MKWSIFDTKKEANEYIDFQRSKGYEVTKPFRRRRPANRPKVDYDGKPVKYCYYVGSSSAVKTLPKDYLPKALAHEQKRVQDGIELDRDIQKIVEETDKQPFKNIHRRRGSG